jgi:uncharacterized iron-regulated protein
MSVRRLSVVALGAGLLIASPAAQSYVPSRVFATTAGAFADFEVMAADLATAGVVFVGEQHDDRNTHRLELAILESLIRRGRSAVVSLEMFERDVQDPLEHFLMGHMPEDEFLQASRPWPRYRTDYKPLVDFAMAHGWPVVAANVPRAIASDVAKGGLDVLAGRSDAERQLFARDLICPTDDEYFRRFALAMGEHPAGDAAEGARMTERYYFSQCLKDETMAESIASAYAIAATAPAPPVVVHFNGAFHSDYGQGTAARVKRRLPDARIAIVSVLPVDNLDTLAPTADDARLGNYLVYTVGGR